MSFQRSSSQSSTRSTKKRNLAKVPVYIEYACFICGNILGNATACINHIKKLHGYEILPRTSGTRRPRHNEFDYIDDQSDPYAIVEYACPSCWFHSPEHDLESLNEHIREEHAPVKVSRMTDENTEFAKTISQKLEELNELFKDLLQ